MNVCFVTGGSGFIGYHLVKRLRERGCRVRCLVRAASNRSRLASLGAEFVEGDLRDSGSLRAAVQGADTIFHLAGLIQARRNEEFFTVNQLGCRSLAQAALAMPNPPRVVSVSSLAAAGAAPKNRPEVRKTAGQKFSPLTETMPVCPVSWYGKSKLAGEREWMQVSDRLPVTILRPPIVFGPGDPNCLSLFTMVLRSSFFLLPGFWDYPYSFVFAPDLAQMMIAAAERGECLTPNSISSEPNKNGSFDCTGKGIYFAAHPESPLFSGFGRMIGQALHHSVHPFFCPPVGVLGTGLFQEGMKRLFGRKVPLDWEKAKEALGGPWYCSGRKIAEELGAAPEGSLQDEVTMTARWYQDQGWFDKKRS